MRAAGGAPANVAVALARLGVPVAFLGKISSDVFGQSLRDTLAAFYAKRTLTGHTVTLDSQVRAITAFLNGDFGKTTGQIVNVDGGQAAAFLR